MKPSITCNRLRKAGTILALLLLLGLGLAAQAMAFTLEVVTKDATGAYIPISASGFRWLLEEDNTNQAPGFPNTGADSNSQPPVPIGADRVRVVVAEHRDYNPNIPSAKGIPTAQISILVFEDHYAINNAPDVPNERGLQGFAIVLFDAAGQLMTDAFGNMLGATYINDGSGNVTVDVPGNGVIRSDANGVSLIKYLMPGKYGVQVIPPTVDPASGEPIKWIQTATIEGTKTIDAWVAANEPPLFIEGFGAGGKHAAFGYVNPATLPWAVNPPTGVTGSISGTNVYNHFSKPPFLQGFFPGAPVGECWVGLNDAVTGQGLMALPCDADSNFVINNVPPGTYQLVPKAARVVGFVNNDLAAEFDPTSPIFGEKAAPQWIPVSFRDWQGNEITRGRSPTRPIPGR